eukprot:4246030-Amphidinium_carterae.1
MHPEGDLSASRVLHLKMPRLQKSALPTRGGRRGWLSGKGLSVIWHYVPVCSHVLGITSDLK